MAPVDSDPDVALPPLQPPDAVQVVASVLDQLRLDALPLTTLPGFADSETVGAGVPSVTVTVTESEVRPPGPSQLKLNDVVCVSAPADSDPDVALPPLQPPDAVQVVASVLDQLRLDALPLTTLPGFADSETVGAGVAGVTVTVAEAVATPLSPSHLNVNTVV
jgi:hypothetical protein